MTNQKYIFKEYDNENSSKFSFLTPQNSVDPQQTEIKRQIIHLYFTYHKMYGELSSTPLLLQRRSEIFEKNCDKLMSLHDLVIYYFFPMNKTVLTEMFAQHLSKQTETFLGNPMHAKFIAEEKLIRFMRLYIFATKVYTLAFNYSQITNMMVDAFLVSIHIPNISLKAAAISLMANEKMIGHYSLESLRKNYVLRLTSVSQDNIYLFEKELGLSYLAATDEEYVSIHQQNLLKDFFAIVKPSSNKLTFNNILFLLFHQKDLLTNLSSLQIKQFKSYISGLCLVLRFVRILRRIRKSFKDKGHRLYHNYSGYFEESRTRNLTLKFSISLNFSAPFSNTKAAKLWSVLNNCNDFIQDHFIFDPVAEEAFLTFLIDIKNFSDIQKKHSK